MSKITEEYKDASKFDVSYYFISVRYNIEIIYEKDITCNRMHDLRIYDRFNNEYLSITNNEITSLLETYIKNKETIDKVIKTLKSK